MINEKLDTDLIIMLLKVIAGLLSAGLTIFIWATKGLFERLKNGDDRFNSIENKITGIEKDITYISTRIKL